MDNLNPEDETFGPDDHIKFTEYKPEELDYDEGPPEPPLATINPYLEEEEDEILDVEEEVWGEGADERWW